MTGVQGRDGDEKHCTVLYFAAASSHAGRDRELFPAPIPLVALLDLLEARHPRFRARVLDAALVAVNLDYVDVPRSGGGGESGGGGGGGGGDGGIVIQPADEVAIIPPVSSG